MHRVLEKHFPTTLQLPEEYLEHLQDLEFMARYKYDNYEMYSPGARFMVHLYSWLKQFTVEHRKAALEFLRRNLIFVSLREMQDLARFLYYDIIVPEILRTIIQKESLQPYDYAHAFKMYFPFYLRRSIFIGLSDGAKIDFFRRQHIQLSQEQILPYYRTSALDYIESLRNEVSDPNAGFWAVFLIDDFTASGSTLIREERDPETGRKDLTGALIRVYAHHQQIIDRADVVYLCHYISTENARNKIMRLTGRHKGYQGKLKCFTALNLPKNIIIHPGNAVKSPLLTTICDMCEKYYDDSFEDVNTRAAGGIKFGYAGSGLPVIIFSNTPNNSIYILWLDSRGSEPGQPFRALFRRIARHRPK